MDAQAPKMVGPHNIMANDDLSKSWYVERNCPLVYSIWSKLQGEELWIQIEWFS